MKFAIPNPPPKLGGEFWVVALLLLFLSSCKVGPTYKTPATPVPATFKESADWKPADPQETALRGKWWEAFNDPQLSTLEEQVDVSNQNVATAEAQFRAARAAIKVARADLFPTVTAGVSATNSRISPNRSPGRPGFNVTTGTVYQIPIDVSYEADVWGRIRRTIEANADLAQATAADLETIRLSMHAELAVDYFQLRGLDEDSRIFRENITAFEQNLQLTINRYNQGIVSQVDVAQAQTQLDTTRAEATDLGVARSQFEHAIAVLTGQPPAQLTIAAEKTMLQPPAIPAGLPSDLLERRPDIASAERRAASANAQIGVAKAAFFPRLTFSIASGFESSRLASLATWPSRFWSLGPALTETVFDAGKRRGLTQEAEANFDSAAAAYRQDVLAAFQDVEDNLAALRILSNEAVEQDVAVASSQRLLDLTLNRYRGGVASYLDVIVAQAALLNNQRTAVGILTRRMTASVLLIKALGGGWDTSQLP
jgi:NodT family efflux transporter outer membrane factor (OMF) lipoprotein